MPVTRSAFAMPTPPLKFMPESASTEVTPSRCSRKSKCQIGPAELAVGHSLQADLLLALDERPDLPVLDLLQGLVRDLTVVMLVAGVLQGCACAEGCRPCRRGKVAWCVAWIDSSTCL